MPANQDNKIKYIILLIILLIVVLLISSSMIYYQSIYKCLCGEHKKINYDINSYMRVSANNNDITKNNNANNEYDHLNNLDNMRNTSDVNHNIDNNDNNDNNSNIENMMNVTNNDDNNIKIVLDNNIDKIIYDSNELLYSPQTYVEPLGYELYNDKNIVIDMIDSNNMYQFAYTQQMQKIKDIQNNNRHMNINKEQYYQTIHY